MTRIDRQNFPVLTQKLDHCGSFSQFLGTVGAVFVALLVGATRGHPLIDEQKGCAAVDPRLHSTADTAEHAYEKALECDPVSAFGGIVAYNRALTGAAAEAMVNAFLEIVVAPEFEPEALEILRRKKNLRIIKLAVTPSSMDELDFKRVRGGMLVQTRMHMVFPATDWRVVTSRQPEANEMDDLRFAWKVCASVKSNAIVLAHDGRTLGIGAGQMSRVDSSRIAVMKANDQGAQLTGAALASDAFFPFRDGVDAAAAAGVKAIIQPGGSVRDEEVIQAANEHGMAMVFTGRRVFRH